MESLKQTQLQYSSKYAENYFSLTQQKVIKSERNYISKSKSFILKHADEFK